MNKYEVSYIRNNVYQAIIVEAETPDHATHYFQSIRPDATICGTREATSCDLKPGKPIIKAQ